MIINKVYHLADLHIRNLQRHKEYRLVFKKFLKQVKEDKSKLADELSKIGKGIAVRRKHEEIERQVGFNLDKNKMHVILINLEKKADLLATEYSPIAPLNNDTK